MKRIETLDLGRLDANKFRGTLNYPALCLGPGKTARRIENTVTYACIFAAWSRLGKFYINVNVSSQVQGAFSTKLRELVVTGSDLRTILPDAFAGLATHELTVRISGTGVGRLPDGLLKYLPDVRYLTLDLRNNRLEDMGPEVLAMVTRSGSVQGQTQHISGENRDFV